MPRKRSELDIAAGQLITSVQKEWNRHAGEGEIYRSSEEVVKRAHQLLLARTQEGVIGLLAGGSVTAYLGEEWLSHHPQVMHYVREFEKALRKDTTYSVT